ncbi:MAG TPA: arginine decarboxylase, partial [Chloroflexi bacterium]|nr:arginine decarboxylase [Chloroflexota bacterium]
MVQLQTYATYLQNRYNRPLDGPLTDFLTRRNGHLFLGDRIDLNVLAERYGTPLEVAYLPQITAQVHRMQAWADSACQASRYTGSFLYAYATKANFAAEVVQTALEAGAHYETSAAMDVEIAHRLWRAGVLPEERLILANGSKEEQYLRAIRRLRLAGCETIIPVLDDLDEFEALRTCPAPFTFGVRERAAGNRDGRHPGSDRFGLTAEEIDHVASALDGSHHTLAVYHAMIGSQVEDRAHFLDTLRASIDNYCALRHRVPSLRSFNFGGGIPTSGYALDFEFDYEDFLALLMGEIRAACAHHGVPEPDLVGEFGRYTVANHSVYLLEVGKVKAGQAIESDWYLVNGSLMVSIPDSVLVEDQEFLILPLAGWDRPARPVRLAGRRTCDSDDIYPRPSRAPLILPDTGVGTVLAVCGIGAYQQMISGRGGAHHCLSPEARRIVIAERNGHPIWSEVPQQRSAEIMRLLGY